jgi:hypothetical protein
MTARRLVAIGFILCCTAIGWAILGSSILLRTGESSGTLGTAVAGSWGPAMTQPQPLLYYNSPGSVNGRHVIQPSQSNIDVSLRYEPVKKGLLWYRTFLVTLRGDYKVENPTPITQTIYIKFQFPAANASYDDFSFVVNGAKSTENNKTSEGITEAITLGPGKSANFSVAYKSRGTNRWGYSFGDATRIRNFHLAMKTDFAEIDFPPGTGSPTERKQKESGWNLVWSYPDVINAQAIAMEMPSVVNPGPVASRMSYFAPVSLLFFFAVLVLVGMVQRVNLHPMNYFFLAAGCFAFQLLFAYLVDLIPALAAFTISAVVSLGLVSGYLFAAAGPRFARIAAIAQFGFIVLFSYTFFFEGLTGLMITIGAIITLALLMATTAKVNWAERLTAKSSTPPPLPAEFA